MSIQLHNLWIDVRPCLKGASRDAAVRLLKDPKAYFVSEEPSLEEVKQLLPTLKARAAIADRSGTTIFGLRALIERLEALSVEKRVWGYGVASPNDAGNFYFLTEANEPVGAAIVRLQP